MRDNSSNTAVNGSSDKSKLIIWGLVVVILLISGRLIWSEISHRRTSRQLETKKQEIHDIHSTIQDDQKEIADQIIEQVGELIELTSDPPPTVATVTDADRLRESNTFFGEAQNGDYIILTNDRAILYNPRQNKVLDVAPFQIDRNSTEPSEDGLDGLGD